MRVWVMAAAVALLGGCVQEASGPGQSAGLQGCQASAASPWRATGETEFSVEALSAGPDCERAVATIIVRNAGGDVMWAEAFTTQFVMTLAQARDAAAMRAALADWTQSSNAAMASTSALPAWREGAQAPESGEFPFYPEAEFDRASYEDVRGRDAPLFCFVQGMESLSCLAYLDGGLTKIGVQTFPG